MCIICALLYKDLWYFLLKLIILNNLGHAKMTLYIKRRPGPKCAFIKSLKMFGWFVFSQPSRCIKASGKYCSSLSDHWPFARGVVNHLLCSSFLLSCDFRNFGNIPVSSFLPQGQGNIINSTSS